MLLLTTIMTPLCPLWHYSRHPHPPPCSHTTWHLPLQFTPMMHLTDTGKVREARALCCQAGQAWRSLSLGGGGDWGPLPVGEPGGEAAAAVDENTAAEELAWQVEGGLAAGRVAWKWTCLAAADAAGGGAPGESVRESEGAGRGIVVTPSLLA